MIGLMLIAGKMTAGEGGDHGQWMTSINPATGEAIGQVPAANTTDVHRAVLSAASAQREWASRSVWERAAVLRQLAAGIRERGAEILQLEARDTGNTLNKLRADIQIAAGYLEFFAGLGSEIKGESIPASAAGVHFTLRCPYGVVARIVPFNHPFMFAAAHLAAPLMAGNAVVVKTPESSPLSGSLLGELCREYLPSGVVNIVHGYGASAGDALVRHPLVRRIGFTGSVPTGLAIQRAAAESGVKHVSLELGGKNPLIAFADADIDRVVDMAMTGMNFSWAGQSCGSTSRLLLHESIHDTVVEQLAARMSALRLGDPLDLASEMGPVNSLRQLERVFSFIEEAKSAGMTLCAGGGKPDGEAFSDGEFSRGYWVAPTLFANVDPAGRLARDEIFGPVVCTLKFRNESDALALANDSTLGLTASVWTRDLGRAKRMLQGLEAGTIWLNGAGAHFVGSPFGGWKDSGLGGEECLDELLGYTQVKAVHWLD